jgi:hypothetical protein
MHDNCMSADRPRVRSDVAHAMGASTTLVCSCDLPVHLIVSRDLVSNLAGLKRKQQNTMMLGIPIILQQSAAQPCGATFLAGTKPRNAANSFGGKLDRLGR